MAKKPELIIFNNYIITGIASFYRNMLENNASAVFDKKVIHISYDAWPDAKMTKPFGLCEEVVFIMKRDNPETLYGVANRLQQLISPDEGALVTNFDTELFTLNYYPRPGKAIYFVCHDDNHYATAKRYEHLIDVFVSHNPVYADWFRRDFPARASQAFYIPYGIKLLPAERQSNYQKPLNIVWLARLVEHKGIHHIPIIDGLLKQQGILVNWTVIGDGPEKAKAMEMVKGRDNFSFHTPPDYEEVVNLLQRQDIYILPSRLDGLPVALIEAMSIGCVPVISAFNPGMQQIISAEMGYVLPVGDNEAFAGTIAKLHSNRSLLEAHSITARRKVYEQYDIDNQAQKYFDLFSRFREFRREKHSRRMIYLKQTILHWLVPPVMRNALKSALKK